MRREIALPTPLHAADLQFQAFAEFDGARALSDIRCPTLVLTGDLDRLIRPQNSEMLAQHIPGAKLVVISGGGHRVLWEAVEECTDLVTTFLSSISSQRASAGHLGHQESVSPQDMRAFAAQLLTAWPAALARAAWESLAIARQSALISSAQFGDGKPIVILTPPFIGSDWSPSAISQFSSA
jgi:hypothetical protein